MNELDLFAAAIAIAEPGERAFLLNQECAGRPDLRTRIEQLLDAHFRSNPLLDQPVQDGTGDFPAPGIATAHFIAAEVEGTVVAGRYKLLQRIGEGGMGAVWMAEQTEPVRRRVAVKLIRVERGQSRTILARFEAERQAIALMDHPNIAKLLDAGMTGEPGGVDPGSPFFVMELVKGVPLTEYCDAHKLGIAERLNLFMQICSAVQHAHQKGIIHRDLKPTNILVESHDDKPVPKVIDFGLAKATTGLQLSEHTLFTAFGTVMGTPLYMAPEQASFNAVDVDTRADIYALGVILYELLTGTTPITRDTVKKAQLDEMLKLIREQEAPTPSSRLSSSESQPSIAANRQMEPQKLGRFVRGELDWIVLKSLSKERDRRYETANGFAKDIERFLNHEPVTAGPPTAGYRLRKFVQRNRGQVLAAGLVLFAILAGMAGTTWGLFEANRSARAERVAKLDALEKANLAIEQRARAEKARDRTRDVLDAMTSAATGDSLSTQKEISADQKKFLTEVLTYYREFAGEKADDEQTRFRTANAAYRVAHIEYRLGRTEQGIAAYQMARDGARKLAVDFPHEPAYDQLLANSLQNLGTLLAGLGKRAEAEEQYCQALAIQEKLAAEFPKVPNFRQDLANSHNNLGNLHYGLEKRTAADEQYRKALAVREKLTADFPAEPAYRRDLAHSHNCLGTLLTQLGKPTEAEEQYRQALAIAGKLAADFPAVPDYRQALAQNHNSLGNLFSSLNKQAAAEEQYRKALAIQEKLAADFPSGPYYRHALAGSHNNLGIMLNLQGNLEAAEEQVRKSLAIQEKLAADFPGVTDYQIELGGSYCNIGEHVRISGRASESLGWYEKAIATLTPIHRTEPRDVKAKLFLGNSHNDRALAYIALKKYSEAAKEWDRVIELSPSAELFEVRTGRANARLHAGLVAEAVAEVAELTKSSNLKADQWYNFACFYAVASGKSAKQKQEYTDRAMELLTFACAAGYKDAAHMKKDTDLDSLRDREDFEKMIVQLEAKSEKK